MRNHIIEIDFTDMTSDKLFKEIGQIFGIEEPATIFSDTISSFFESLRENPCSLIPLRKDDVVTIKCFNISKYDADMDILSDFFDSIAFANSREICKGRTPSIILCLIE